jgi:hypothetical protein
MIIYGYKSIREVNDEEVIVIGGVRSKTIKCQSLNVYGLIRAEHVLCDRVILYGTGYIRSLNTRSGLFISTNHIIYINDLKAGEAFIHGKKRPVIISELRSYRAVVTRSIIDYAHVDDELILGVGAHIRRVNDSPQIIFLDPYVRIERFEGEPRRIMYNY